MKTKLMITFTTALALFSFPQTIAAYVGPGAGLTLIGSLIGVVVAILVALGVILFWPVRALIRRIRGKKPDATSATETPNPNAPKASSDPNSAD